jgi:hypothetical protein
MPNPTPDPYIQLWFKQLGQFRSACINNTVGKLDLLDFANAEIVKALPSDDSKDQFITAVGASTGCDDFDIADLTTYKTFRGLLDDCHLLSNDVFNVLQAGSAAELQGVDSETYYKAQVSKAFPGGSKGAGWMPVQEVLVASMDASCFTKEFRDKVNATVDKAGSTMNNLITEIAVLG